MNKSFNYEKVTLLITHYNRSKSLERLLSKFVDLKCQFEDIVVSDDGSKVEHLNYIKNLQKSFSFILITTAVNRGLGNNLNKGQQAVKSEFTLYVQEDFIPTSLFPEKFKAALDIFKDRKEIDIIRFYAYFKYPYLKPYKDGFAEMQFNLLLPGYKKFYYYSDHPHLRRSNFLQKFGKYDELKKSDRTEYLMMMSFLKKGGKGLYFEEYTKLFVQSNSSAEPSTIHRNFWRESGNFVMIFLREIYRHTRFNLDFLFTR